MHFLIECLPLFSGPLLLLFFRITRSLMIKWLSLIAVPLLLACVANQLTGEGPQLLGMDMMKALLSTAVVLLLGRLFRRYAGK